MRRGLAAFLQKRLPYRQPFFLLHISSLSYVHFVSLLTDASAGDGKQPVACLKQISDRLEDQRVGLDLWQSSAVTSQTYLNSLALVFLTNAYLQVRAGV